MGSAADHPSGLSPMKLFTASRAFILNAIYPDFWGSTARAGGKVGKTAYLDGLRGVAALMIYAQHNTDYAHMRYHPVINRGWGWQGNYYFTRTPGVALFFHTGNLAVMFFFAISGYVTSLSLLKLVHSQDTAKLAYRMGAAIPQRFVRLWGPAMGVTFTFMFLCHLFGIAPEGPRFPLAPTLGQDIPRWFWNFFHKSFLFSPFAPIPDDLYDPHLWYIPLQFQASILTYVILLCMLAYCRYPSSVRIWTMIALTFYFGYLTDAYFCALTTFGIVLCDIDLLADQDALPAPFSWKLPNWFWYIPLTIGFIFCNCPSDRDPATWRAEDPGWYYLSYFLPSAASHADHWFNAWASVLLLIAIPRIHWVRRVFELDVLRDLGKITFSFYLVQGPLLWTVGHRIYAAVGLPRPGAERVIPGWVNAFPLPEVGPMGCEINFVLANMVLLPFMVWAGSAAVKLYEVPCGHLATWLFKPERYNCPPVIPRKEQLPVVDKERQHSHPSLQLQQHLEKPAVLAA